MHIQFKPVPVLAEDPIRACKIPARITGSGMVSSVDKEQHSFIIFPTQKIMASSDPQTLPVRALMEKGLKWPNPVARLPAPHGFVAFTGKLAHFEDNVGHIRGDLCSRTVVSLDSIIYLCTNYGSNNATMPLPPPSLPHDTDTVALKTHILKFSQGDTHSPLSKGDDRSCNVDMCSEVPSEHEQEECEDDN
jgi:hypothetical protein